MNFTSRGDDASKAKFFIRVKRHITSHNCHADYIGTKASEKTLSGLINLDNTILPKFVEQCIDCVVPPLEGPTFEI